MVQKEEVAMEDEMGEKMRDLVEEENSRWVL